jgi:protocatechuate 3,4-dioxygenase beta subunit
MREENSMKTSSRPLSRRGMIKYLLQAVGAGVGLLALPSRAAARLRSTPAQIAGPYYPRDKPGEVDWNLLSVGDGPLPAGVPLDLSGVVLERSGRPAAGALVEIWQSDDQGIYDHARDDSRARFDRRFQGYGSLETDADGTYRFLTLMPVPYGKRPPHIHVTIRYRGKEELTTQLYIKDHPENKRDGFMALMLYPAQDKLLIDPADAALEGGMRGKSARFDFVIG